jgi:hypothetical protein
MTNCTKREPRRIITAYQPEVTMRQRGAAMHRRKQRRRSRGGEACGPVRCELSSAGAVTGGAAGRLLKGGDKVEQWARGDRRGEQSRKP